MRHWNYRIQWHLRPLLEWANDYPLAVDIETANACNLRCTMCHQSTGWLKEDQKVLLDFATLERVVTEAVEIGVHSMKVNWRGEPLLHPEIVRIVKFIKDHGIPEVMMNTNGILMTRQIADGLINAGLDRIIFSCDGISKRTYEKIRRGAKWDQFLENVKMFRGRCLFHKSMGAERVPKIRINCAIQEKNRGEIGKFRKFWKGIADEVRFNTVYRPLGNSNMEGRKKKRHGCPQVYQRLVVDARGNVMPCCADYREELNLGNIHENSLTWIWNVSANKIRKMHERHMGRILNGCRYCDLFALSEIDTNDKVIWR